MIVQTHHVLAQTRGLSYCYNQQLKRADPEISVMKMKQSEWLEKWGFLIFLVSTVCLQQLYFNVEGQWRWLVYLAWAGLALGALMIYGGAFYFPNVLASNKIPFLLRLVVYPLGLFSLIASSAVGIAHGVEYVCVFHKISNRGISEKHKLKKVLLAGVLLMTVHGAVFTFRHTVGANVMLDSSSFGFMWLVALKALYSSLTLLHYYLDRQIFRMREPHTRSQIGPLIA